MRSTTIATVVAPIGRYFLGLFAAGWVLGPIREFILAPRLGSVAAHAVEAIALIVAVLLIARWAAGGLGTGLQTITGLAATALLIMGETLGAKLLRGQSAAEFLLPADFRLAAIQWGLLAWVAVAPRFAVRA